MHFGWSKIRPHFALRRARSSVHMEDGGISSNNPYPVFGPLFKFWFPLKLFTFHEDMHLLSSTTDSILLKPYYIQNFPKFSNYSPKSIKGYQMSTAMEDCRVRARVVINPAERSSNLSRAPTKNSRMGLERSITTHCALRKIYMDECKHRNTVVKAGPTNGEDAFEPSHQCILLDIEGTTTPISFVTDVLFPYARDNVRKHLTATYDTEETKEDIKLLRAQVEDDLRQGVTGARPIPPDETGMEEVILSLVANVEAMISADRKITALKQLQGHVWRTGFQCREIESVIFEDVPLALKKWQASGIKVYIYSSGSREAQRLIFGNTSYGDLRKYLCGFFDTTIGNKRETRSYFEIYQTLGVDNPSQVLFLTDVYQEAVAASAAGLDVIISVRPGNGPLPDNHGFKTIQSFSEI